jgi:hypothetical protein
LLAAIAAVLIRFGGGRKSARIVLTMQFIKWLGTLHRKGEL